MSSPKIDKALAQIDDWMLEGALADPLVPAENIAAWLTAKGHPCSASTVRSHRRDLRRRQSVDGASR